MKVHLNLVESIFPKSKIGGLFKLNLKERFIKNAAIIFNAACALVPQYSNYVNNIMIIMLKTYEKILIKRDFVVVFNGN